MCAGPYVWQESDMRQSIVTYGGDPDGIGPIYNMSFECPPAQEQSTGPTESQRAAVASFFGFEVEDERYCPVNALLTYRDYGRLAAAVIYPVLSGERLQLVARAIAAFISQDPDMRADVKRWSDRRWRGAAAPDSAAASLPRTKHFTAVADFTVALLLDMRDAGAPIHTKGE